MQRLTIIAIGTRGDVQPAIALGRALGETGYAVRILASRGFRDCIEGHGLEAVPTSVDMEALMASDLGRAWTDRGHNPIAQQRLMRQMVDQIAAAAIAEAWDACRDADAIVGSFTSDAFTVTFGEALDRPVLSMPLQPALIATADGRAMSSAPLPDRVSRINRWFGRLVLEPFPWGLYGRHVNRFRASIGLPSHSGRENAAARRRMTVLHAVSRHVLPRPADWPATYHVTGYWFLDDARDWQPSPELESFLADGSPTIGVGFGSMIGRDPVATGRLVVAAIEQSGARAVLLGGWAGLSAEPGRRILTLPSAPHDWLFPRLAAVVHHGGAGTTAAGLRAGIPSVLVPHLGDQHYWARRVRALGVGAPGIPRYKLTAPALAEAIRAAIGDAGIRERAAALGERIRAETGLETAVAIIRETLESGASDPVPGAGAR